MFYRTAVVMAIALGMAAQGAEQTKPRAARSVHWGWPAPDAEFVHTSMVIERSAPGSYFMACGWNTGYFGLQELADGRKVILLSVWDSSDGDDPGAVEAKDRVECLFSDPETRIRRFGGEGTGGQCMGDFDWEIGETNRFLVRAVQEGPKTSYTGYVLESGGNQWRKLVTFRTFAGGKPFNGFYSFVEDFRRDFKSAEEVRRARFGDGWVKSERGDWIALARGRFTASGAEWEAKETIDAGLEQGWFFLQTGGDTLNRLPLRSLVERIPLAVSLPEFDSVATE